MMRCPVCKSKTVGRVGQNQFYCWDCCIEYQLCGRETKVFSVLEDGSLINFEPMLIG